MEWPRLRVVVRLTTPMLRRNMIMVENAEAWPKFRLFAQRNPTRDASLRPDLNSFAAAAPCRAQAAPLILEHMKEPVKTEDSAKQRRSQLRAGAAWTIDARVEVGGRGRANPFRVGRDRGSETRARRGQDRARPHRPGAGDGQSHNPRGRAEAREGNRFLCHRSGAPRPVDPHDRRPARPWRVRERAIQSRWLGA